MRREVVQQVEHVLGDAPRHLVRNPADGVVTLESAVKLVGGGAARRSRDGQNVFEDLFAGGANAGVVVGHRHVDVGQRREERRHQD